MTNAGESETKERCDALAHYARQYTLSRTLPFLAQTAAILVVFTAIFGGALALGYARMIGNRPLTIAAAIVEVLGMAGCLWLSVPRWGGKTVWKWGTRLYDSEGQVCTQERPKVAFPWWGYAVLVYFLLGIPCQGALTAAGLLPVRYAQPFSVLYMVPFLVMLSWVQRGVAGKWQWVAPALYTLYAVLVLAGLPLASSDPRWGVLNMSVPIFGSLAAGMIAGHVYNRYALAKVKQLARVEAEEDGHA